MGDSYDSAKNSSIALEIVGLTGSGASEVTVTTFD